MSHCVRCIFKVDLSNYILRSVAGSPRSGALLDAAAFIYHRSAMVSTHFVREWPYFGMNTAKSANLRSIKAIIFVMGIIYS